MKKCPLYFFLLFFPLNLVAQSARFPVWMDEVEFKRPSLDDQSDFKQLPTPVDPETGKPVQISTQKKLSEKFKKPKLPDFKKLRAKAVKVNSNETSATKKDYFPMNNEIESLFNDKSELSKLLQSLVKTSDSDQDEQKALKEKAAALADLISLLHSQKQSFANTLQGFSTSKPIQALQSMQNTKTSNNERKPANETRPERKFYRPPRIRSFFLENKQKQD